ncbi:MAG: PQQ-binding-like beta-propeller repeat protein [Thermoguttaceae bacterium]
MTRLLLFSFCFFSLTAFQVSLAANLPDNVVPGRRDSRTGNITGTSENVRWAVPIGYPTYAAPAIGNGKVLVGTLNSANYDSNRSGSRSVLLCFDEKSGEFLWQLPLPKDYGIPYFDSYCVGISSTPTIDAQKNRAFLTSGRGEVFCIDLEGQADGNAGPYKNEAELFSFRDEKVGPLTDKDADIIWRYDMFGELKSKPHDTNNCDIIFDNGLLYVNTGNAPNQTHQVVETPDAPALIVLDAETGKLLARDNFPIGNDISHGQWCSPTLANVDGTKYVFYGAGNGVLYAVKAFEKATLLEKVKQNGEKPIIFQTEWYFHGDPRAQKGSVEKVPPFETRMGSASYTCLPPPAYENGRVFMLFGHDGWNGAKPLRSWLACIDAKIIQEKTAETPAKTGTAEPINRTETALLWGTGNIEGGAISPLAIQDGLLYFADRKGNFYCYETESGQEIWKLSLKGDIWARPLVADDKIYVGTDRRMFYVLRAGRVPEIISEIQMPDQIFAPAAVSENTVFIVGEGFLYAVEK